MTDMTDTYTRMLARSFGLDKQAFVPLGEGEKAAQAAGPGGQPVDPSAGGGDPAAAGAPPMDPAAMGMDPAAMGGMPPMDPAAMGMDPAAMGGMPPMDPAALGMDPAAMGGLPPADAPPAGGEGLTSEDAEIAEQLAQRTVDRTMDIVERTLAAVGKGPKKPAGESTPSEGAAPVPELAAPAAQPGLAAPPSPSNMI